MWPFPIDWTDQDTRAVIQNVIASVVLIIVGDGLLRVILGIAFGARPRLRIDVSKRAPLKDVDWPHLVVTNVGLPFSPRTRGAEAVTAYGTLDGVERRFLWATSADRPPEQVDIYSDRSAEIPLVARSRQNVIGTLYGNVVPPQTACLTEVEFLTQAFEGKIAPTPIADGDHDLTLTVHALDGTRTTARFGVTVPPWPGAITLRKM